MNGSILIAGSGRWADLLLRRTAQHGLEVTRVETLVGFLRAAARVRPEFCVVGPALSKEEIVQAFVLGRDAMPGTRIVVAFDRDDPEFARDLEAIGVPWMALVPAGLDSLEFEAIVTAGGGILQEPEATQVAAQRA